VAEAFSVSGDADYVLILQCENLRTFSNFIHTNLLPQKIIGQVRSEIVLREIKRSL
jgi:DNA-binding Lrp family transcriptional regulator